MQIHLSDENRRKKRKDLRFHPATREHALDVRASSDLELAALVDRNERERRQEKAAPPSEYFDVLEELANMKPNPKLGFDEAIYERDDQELLDLWLAIEDEIQRIVWLDGQPRPLDPEVHRYLNDLGLYRFHIEDERETQARMREIA